MNFQSHRQTAKPTLHDSSFGNDRAHTVNKREEVAAMLDPNETDGTTIASDDDEAEAKMGERGASLFECQVTGCKHLDFLDRGGLHYHSKTVDHSIEQIVCCPIPGCERPVRTTEHDLSEHLLNLKVHMDEEVKTYAEDPIWQSRRIKAENELRKDQDAKPRCDCCSRCGSLRSSSETGSGWASIRAMLLDPIFAAEYTVLSEVGFGGPHSIMIPPQVHLRRPWCDFCFL
ncbi:hypothetical protein LTR17_002979 [Elasticomyces elasticus]|nr:hypothetical protein LTR17_002979 [Elasticomyces elasticus]